MIEAYRDLGFPSVSRHVVALSNQLNFILQLEISAMADNNDIFRRSFSYCSFLDPKGLNFMAQFFISHLQKRINPEILKCPFKKGTYKAVDHLENKLKLKNLQLPPFIRLGQKFDVTIVFKSMISKRSELLCSVLLNYVVGSS